MNRTSCVAAFSLLALASGAAQAQTVISCRPHGDDYTGWLSATLKISPNSIQTWSGSAGWSANNCVGNGHCSFDQNAYVIQWPSRSNGQYGYSITDNTISIHRRTGVAVYDYATRQYKLDGSPNPYNNPFDGSLNRGGTATCAPAADPALAVPLF